MRSIIRLIAILSLSSVVADQPTETTPKPIDNQLYSLFGHGSSIELRTFKWTGDANLIIRFVFQTRSYQGQVLRLIATNEARDPALEIKIAIERRTVRVSAEDFVVKAPISKLYFPREDVSDGGNHTMVINVNPSGGDLLIELDGDHRTAKLGLQKSGPLDTTIYLGGVPVEPTSSIRSIIGCIGKATVDFGSNIQALVAETTAGDVQEGCLDACRSSSCSKENPSGCLNNFLEPICDCVGTGKEGALCNERSKVYNFDGGQYFAYELGPHEEDRQPRRVHASFKAERSDEPSLLLYAPLATNDKTGDANGLSVIVNKDSIDVRLRGVPLLEQATKHGLRNDRWHDLTLHIDYPKSEINIKLDDQTFKTTPWSHTGAEIFFRELYFGGSTHEDILAKNFRGCLRNAFIDYKSITQLIMEESRHLRFGKTPVDGSCPLADFEDPTTPSVGHSTHLEPLPTVLQRDERVFRFTLSPAPPAVKCSDLQCQHKANCVESHLDAICDCKESGYVGKLCQFSNLPRTCDELFQSGERHSAVYRVDPDGSGPIDPVYVKCDMEDNGGVTLVDHNFIDGTYVRQLRMKDTTYLVEYRNMSTQALRTLTSVSDKCEQYFKYECNEAPLHLENKTWFKSADHDQAFYSIGGSISDRQCPCGRHRSCGLSKCSCDVGDKQTRSDEAFNVGQLAGITEMTFLQNSTNPGWAKISLGPLKCHGSKGTDDTVQFRNPQSIFRFGKWKGRQLSFWFRTSVKDARLFSQSSTNGDHFNLNLEDGHTLAFYFNFGKDDVSETTVRVVSQKLISDDSWHRVRVEASFNQIRFSIDNKEDQFYAVRSEDTLDESSFDGDFILGGSDDPSVTGYVGCVRQLVLNDVSVRLSSEDLPEGVVAGCQKHCTPESCFNNAECIEDYEHSTFRCKCINEYTFLGPKCERDINKGTEVSFLSSSTHLTVLNFIANPISSRLVFSFRTDQISALLFFAHDENYNAVQIHLADGNRVFLTTNYGDQLLQCNITKERGDFNDMRWYQIRLVYELEHTSLYVDKDLCQISGGRRLSKEYLDRWEGDIHKLKVVIPPRSPVPPTKATTYTLLFVGGVAQVGHRTNRQSRQVVYSSDLPNFLGCVRGFMVGNEMLDLKKAKASGSVKSGCDVGCGNGDLRCQRGGYCRVDWEGDQKAHCDCAPTSYFGPNCTYDHGLHFEAGVFVQVQLELILLRLRLPENRAYDSLSFAFSTDLSTRASTTQIVAHVRVNSEKDLRIYLQADGQVLLRVFEPDVRSTPGRLAAHEVYNHTFRGKYNDGERHFVFLKFFGDKLVAKVDNQQKEVDRVAWRLSDVRTVSIGGSNVNSSDHVSYTGCMTNALIEFRSANSFELRPFDSLLNPRRVWQESYQKFVPEGRQLAAAQCAQFTVEKPMPTEGPVTAMPPFTQPMRTEAYVATGAPPLSGGEKERGIGIAIGLGVVVIIVLLCVIVYLYYAKCVKNRRHRNAQYAHPVDNDHYPASSEKQVFLSSPDDQEVQERRPGARHPQTGVAALPEANEDLEERSNRGSVTDRRPVPSSSPPPPYGPKAASSPNQETHAAINGQTDEDFPPPPSDEELKAMWTPVIKRAFTFELSDTDKNAVAIPRSPKSPLAHRPSLPRRMPVDVPIPKV